MVSLLKRHLASLWGTAVNFYLLSLRRKNRKFNQCGCIKIVCSGYTWHQSVWELIITQFSPHYWLFLSWIEFFSSRLSSMCVNLFSCETKLHIHVKQHPIGKALNRKSTKGHKSCKFLCTKFLTQELHNKSELKQIQNKQLQYYS